MPNHLLFGRFRGARTDRNFPVRLLISGGLNRIEGEHQEATRGPKILVQANEARPDSGLVIPDTAKEKPQGTVVAVGPIDGTRTARSGSRWTLRRSDTVIYSKATAAPDQVQRRGIPDPVGARRAGRLSGRGVFRPGDPRARHR